MQPGCPDKTSFGFIIPKKSRKGYRLIHEFSNKEHHTTLLYEMRKVLFERSDPVFNGVVNLRKSVFGYPYGTNGMIKLVRSFNTRPEGFEHCVTSSYDIENFYHSIQPYHVWRYYQEIYPYARAAFVDVGNGIKVLAQGSPLSQDISNIVLTKFDLSMLKACARYSDIRWLLKYKIKRKSGDFVTEKDIKVRYMRYIDNIYIKVFYKGDDDHIARVISEILRKKISRYLPAGININPDKSKMYSSKSNRRETILGLNTTKEVKCKKYYIDNVRASLHQFLKEAEAQHDLDMSRELAGRIVYVATANWSNIARFKKYFRRMQQLKEANSERVILNGIFNYLYRTATEQGKQSLRILDKKAFAEYRGQLVQKSI